MKHSVCPQCGSRPRHRLIPYAIYHVGLNYTNTVLMHVGPNLDEIAYIYERFTPQTYYRLDIDPRPFTNLRADLCALPLPDGSVDHILIWHVLEHIPDDRTAIAEMYRILSDGGTVLVSVPIYPPNRRTTYEDPAIPRERYEEAYGHPDHVRACGLDYGERFAEAGFHVDTLSVAKLAHGDKALYGLSGGHVVWCCTKRSAD